MESTKFDCFHVHKGVYIIHSIIVVDIFDVSSECVVSGLYSEGEFKTMVKKLTSRSRISAQDEVI